ncbi:MAG: hypothetical protein Q9187_002978 [Circinaria calcarea]
MATTIPAALRAADLSRFIVRAAQVEKAKPVTKAEHPQNDAILDDVAGQAYVEQFGLETFQRADNAVRANKASRQTADTFQAAATFLDLLHIWGPLDPEVASKIKFAKYHALRIAKALKAGEDPNLSNPISEPSPIQEQPPLDPNDPEVQALVGTSPSTHSSIRDHQPFAGDASNQDYTTGPSTLSPHGTVGENYYQSQANELPPLGALAAGRIGSEGGGYFPSVPHGYTDTGSPVLPEAPPEEPGSPPTTGLPDPSSLPPSTTANYLNGQEPIDPHNLPVHPNQHPYLDPSVNPQNSLPSRQPAYSSQPPVPGLISPPARPSNPTPITASTHRMATQQAKLQPAAGQLSYVPDEEAMVKAQKHARWAISALNFEDVNTAVKELKGALESLGAA